MAGRDPHFDHRNPGLRPAGRPTASRITVPAASGPDPGDNALAGPHSITTAYTRNGVPYQQTYPGVAGSNQTFTETVVTGFNSHGQPNTLGATVGAPYTEEVLYDAVGRAARTTMGPAGGQEGLFITSAWNTDGRLYRQRAETRIGQEIQDDIYTYDAAGNPLQISHDQMWSGSDESKCFQYDDRQRLTRSFTLNGLSACPAEGQPINPSGPNPYYELHSVDHLGRIFHLDGTNRTHGATTPTGCRTY